MADPDAPRPPTNDELYRSILGLWRFYEDVATRCEALRILGVNKGVWTEAEFQDGVAVLLQRGREAGARDLANADPERRAAFAEILRRHESDPH